MTDQPNAAERAEPVSGDMDALQRWAQDIVDQRDDEWPANRIAHSVLVLIAEVERLQSFHSLVGAVVDKEAAQRLWKWAADEQARGERAEAEVCTLRAELKEMDWQRYDALKCCDDHRDWISPEAFERAKEPVF